MSLDITTTGGSTVTVGAQPEQQYSNSNMTNALCRTWNLGKVRLYEQVGGQVIVDQLYNSYSEFVVGMLKLEGYEPTDYEYQEELKYMLVEAPQQVVFRHQGISR